MIQNEDIKTEAQLIADGGVKAQLPNDTKVYVTANSFNERLDEAVTNGDIVNKNQYSAKGKILVGTGTNTYTSLSVGTNTHVLTADSAEASGVKWAATTGATAILAKSASYTIVDADIPGYDLILEVTTSSTDRTITLPTLADNQAKRILIRKSDSGTGKVIIDGEGAETINNATTYTLLIHHDEITIVGAVSTWAIECERVTPVSIRYTTNAGQTVNDTAVLIHEDLDYATHSGLYNTGTGVFTVPRAGIYEVSVAARLTSASNTINQAWLVIAQRNNAGTRVAICSTVTTATSYQLCGLGAVTNTYNATDTIRLLVSENLTTSATLEADGSVNYIQINEIR